MSEMYAYSNPEYMSFDELTKLSESLLKNLANPSSSCIKLGPAPSKPPPPPPKTPPKIKHNKPRLPLYQNVPDDLLLSNKNAPTVDSYLDEIHIDCFAPPKTPINSSRKEFLLTTTSANYLSSTLNYNSSLSINSSDSSTATMIVRKSPQYTRVVRDESEIDEAECSIVISNDLSPSQRLKITCNPNINLDGHFLLINNSKMDTPCSAYANKRSTSASGDSSNSSSKTNKLISSLSPIMTSSRADLYITNAEDNTLLPCSPSCPNKFGILKTNTQQHCFNNNNYFMANSEPVKASKDSISPDTSISSHSSLSSLILLPPSPFKTPIVESEKKQQNTIKKVSFAIREETGYGGIEEIKHRRSSLTLGFVTTSSASNSSVSPNSSISSTVSKEKILTKIFSNDDYFIGPNFRNFHIESSSISSIPISSSSSCSSTSSSTSSTSSGYKSNQSCSLHQISTNISEVNSTARVYANGNNVELNSFIETNLERLNRLKNKRNQIFNTSKLNKLSFDAQQSFEEFAKVDSLTPSVKSLSPNNENVPETPCVKNGNFLIKTESAKLFQKLFNFSKSTSNSSTPIKTTLMPNKNFMSLPRAANQIKINFFK